MLEDERWGVGKYDGVMLQDADLPPAVICEPMELVRAAHEAAAEQALHRSRTFQHLVFQQLSEAEADLLVEVEASLMEHRDLGQALRGPLGTLEMALREKLEQHRMQEAEASREALHALASQLRAQHDDQIRKQVVVATFTEQHAEAKLKAAIALVQRVKGALQTHGAALAAAKAAVVVPKASRARRSREPLPAQLALHVRNAH